MSRKYKFRNPEAAYFVSFSVVEWLDVFSNDAYKQILLDSLKFCQREKGMEIYAWIIMTTHVHLVFRSTTKYPPELLLGDFKRFTSKAIVRAIQEASEDQKSRTYLSVFRKYGERTSNVKNFQFWQHDNRPIELWSKWVIDQKINYIHQNPVVAGFVDQPGEYLFSSARDYMGEVGILEGVVVCK